MLPPFAIDREQVMCYDNCANYYAGEPLKKRGVFSMDVVRKKEVDAIVKALADTHLVTKIILFGSSARGEDTLGSDIDLCALTAVNDRHPADVGIDLRMKIFDIQTSPLDLLIYNQDEFVRHAKRPTSFEHEIAEHGVVLYERG